jgi:hypothetical protein
LYFDDVLVDENLRFEPNPAAPGETTAKPGTGDAGPKGELRSSE